MNILILEASTSAAKAMIFTEGAGVAKVATRNYPPAVSDVATQDADGVIDALAASAGSVLRDFRGPIDVIGLVSVWHSMLLLDEKRRPSGRIRTWADTSASNLTRRVRADEARRNFFYGKSGCNPHSIYPLWKYLHLKASAPHIAARAAYVSSLPEYLFERLTDQCGTSVNEASGSGLLNIHDRTWDEQLLAEAGLTAEQLGPVFPLTHTQPLSASGARLLGLAKGVPVVITSADGAMNQVGEGVLHGAGMTLSIGTSAAMRMGSDAPVLPRKPATWCYYAGERRWLAGAAIAGAGNCISWFMKQHAGPETTKAGMETRLGTVDRARAPLFLPFLFGERSPGWDDARQAQFCDLLPHHGQVDLYYAILEGILFNLRQNHLALKEMGLVPKDIVVSGGIVNSGFWTQMAADILQTPIYVSSQAHSSMMGGVAVAMKAMGAIKNLSAFRPPERRMVAPNPENSALFSQRYQRYRNWYAKTGSEALGLFGPAKGELP